MATQIYLGNPPENIKQFIIENYGSKEDPMLKVPLHFVAEEPGATMSFSIGSGTYETSTTGEEGSWTSYKSGTTITLANVDDKVYFRAGSDNGNEYCSSPVETSMFIINGEKIAAKGNIQSLLDRKMERMDVPNMCYSRLFSQCTSLTQAPLLPATTLDMQSYGIMFMGCTSLTQAPLLPATTLGEACYQDMFRSCSSIPEPKYNMSNMTFDEVAKMIQTNLIFGMEGEYHVQCSDKNLIAVFDEANWEWTITEG